MDETADDDEDSIDDGDPGLAAFPDVCCLLAPLLPPGAVAPVSSVGTNDGSSLMSFCCDQVGEPNESAPGVDQEE